ncbi:MAG TPA: ABC transporter permease [Bryobacteraceae bacterium]|nr:ABC transporter permease [Bryobacteraceae bacterium]
MPRRIPGTLFLRNLVERRSLLFQLVRRDFEQRFVGSAIGWIWGLIHPLVLLVSWIFIFVICLKQTLPAGEVTTNYPLFIFAGMLPWLLFSETVQRSAGSLLDQANLITKTVFPSEIIPVSIFLSTLVSHLLALILMIGAAAFFLKSISVFIFMLPLYMLLIGLFAVGIGWIVAGLHVYLRDTAQILIVILTFWFWLTPIFITERQFPPWSKFLLAGNPMAYVVRGYRQLLLGHQPPGLTDFGIALLYAAVTFVLGGLFFRHMKRGFADVL